MAEPPPQAATANAETPVPQPLAPAEAPSGVSAPAPVALASANVEGARSGAEIHCRTLAKQRKHDAKANGYDDDLADQVYAGTYKTCMDWDAAHPG
jgi:hypothetical protein